MKSDLLLRLATCPVGDGEPECRAFTLYGVRSDLTVQSVHDGLGNRKPQSCSFLVFVQLHKPPEYVRQFFGRNPCSGVLYIKINFSIPGFISDTDRTFMREFNRVGRKVGEHLGDAVAVGRYETGKTRWFCYDFNHSAGIIHPHLEKLL